MCGRFSQNYTWQEVQAFLRVFGTPRNLQPHYNLAPTTIVDVIRHDAEGTARAGVNAMGPIPYWWNIFRMDAAYHDRMPALLQEAEIDRWLSGDMTADELHSASKTAFRVRAVSTRLNKSSEGDDDPTILEEIEPQLL